MFNVTVIIIAACNRLKALLMPPAHIAKLEGSLARGARGGWRGEGGDALKQLQHAEEKHGWGGGTHTEALWT